MNGLRGAVVVAVVVTAAACGSSGAAAKTVPASRLVACPSLVGSASLGRCSVECRQTLAPLASLFGETAQPTMELLNGPAPAIGITRARLARDRLVIRSVISQATQIRDVALAVCSSKIVKAAIGVNIPALASYLAH